LSSLHGQSLVARRVTGFHCEAETEVEFEPVSFQQMAGLILYYDTSDFAYLRITFDEKHGKRVGLARTCRAEWQEFPESEQSLPGTVPCRLKVVIDGPEARFFHAVGDDVWHPVGPSVSIVHMSDEGPKGFRFTGMFVGICVQDLAGRNCLADFAGFRYALAGD
jgi:xylan 1,4-beta-xylosidase